MRTAAANRAAMTLVELCVSLAIAASLVTATLSATSAIARQDRLLGAMYDKLANEQLLRNALAMDVLHSNSIVEIKDEGENATKAIELTTCWSISKETFEIQRTEASIRYEIRVIAGDNWLCRVENHGTEGENTKTTLVAKGIDKIKLADQQNETTSDDSVIEVETGVIELAVTMNGNQNNLLLYTNN